LPAIGTSFAAAGKDHTNIRALACALSAAAFFGVSMPLAKLLAREAPLVRRDIRRSRSVRRYPLGTALIVADAMVLAWQGDPNFSALTGPLPAVGACLAHRQRPDAQSEPVEHSRRHGHDAPHRHAH
jgi:hypothetical protein